MGHRPPYQQQIINETGAILFPILFVVNGSVLEIILLVRISHDN